MNDEENMYKNEDQDALRAAVAADKDVRAEYDKLQVALHDAVNLIQSSRELDAHLEHAKIREEEVAGGIVAFKMLRLCSVSSQRE